MLNTEVVKVTGKSYFTLLITVSKINIYLLDFHHSQRLRTCLLQSVIAIITLVNTTGYRKVQVTLKPSLRMTYRLYPLLNI